MKSLILSIIGLCVVTIGTIVSSSVAFASNDETTRGEIAMTANAGVNSSLEISGPLAKRLFFDLDVSRQRVAYSADCSEEVPGCAARIGKNIVCSNGSIGDPELNYRCFIDVIDARSGEFKSSR